MKQLIKQCIPSTRINRLMGQWLVTLARYQSKPYGSADVSALIAAPGGGNIGDQAMLESFLHNVSGKKLIITTNHNPIQIPVNYALDTEILPLPGLVYGEPHTFWRDMRKLIKRLPQLQSLSVIGADVMDGGYNPHASAMRAYITKFASELGVPSRILGFSWNKTPHSTALNAVKQAGNAGVKLFIRDGISHQRLLDAGCENTVLTADVVFANQNQLETGIEDILDYCQSKKIAIVNASGLIAKDLDQIEEYKVIINRLQSAGYQLVLLPHVIREGANDLAVCERIAALYPEIFFVNRLLQPDQIKRLVRTAELVVTGRMHLSIMSLNAGVPAIVLSTQGKVDGLMKFFSTPELSVEPISGFGQQVSQLIDRVQNNHEHYITQLSNNIDVVRNHAKKNFQY